MGNAEDEGVREGAVVVKVSRPHQDMRFDIPTIGPETIDSLIAAKAAVLAVEAKKTLVVDKDEIARKADAAGTALSGLDEDRDLVNEACCHVKPRRGP